VERYRGEIKGQGNNVWKRRQNKKKENETKQKKIKKPRNEMRT
jgi:hypothetical protein